VALDSVRTVIPPSSGTMGMPVRTLGVEGGELTHGLAALPLLGRPNQIDIPSPSSEVLALRVFYLGSKTELITVVISFL
jgi:hypothetical protein